MNKLTSKVQDAYKSIKQNIGKVVVGAAMLGMISTGMGCNSSSTNDVFPKKRSDKIIYSFIKDAVNVEKSTAETKDEFFRKLIQESLDKNSIVDKFKVTLYEDNPQVLPNGFYNKSEEIIMTEEELQKIPEVSIDDKIQFYNNSSILDSVDKQQKENKSNAFRDTVSYNVVYGFWDLILSSNISFEDKNKNGKLDKGERFLINLLVDGSVKKASWFEGGNCEYVGVTPGAILGTMTDDKHAEVEVDNYISSHARLNDKIVNEVVNAYLQNANAYAQQK